MTDFGIATGAYVRERDDWPAAIAKAAAESRRFVELTAITEERLGTHRPTTAGDLDLYAPLLDRCRHVPRLLESELVE